MDKDTINWEIGLLVDSTFSIMSFRLLVIRAIFLTPDSFY